MLSAAQVLMQMLAKGEIAPYSGDGLIVQLFSGRLITGRNGHPSLVSLSLVFADMSINTRTFHKCIL